MNTQNNNNSFYVLQIGLVPQREAFLRGASFEIRFYVLQIGLVPQPHQAQVEAIQQFLCPANRTGAPTARHGRL